MGLENERESDQRESRVTGIPSSYFREVAEHVDEEPTGPVGASVVIVSFQTVREEFETTLDALDDQTVDNFETIVVDNGNDWPVEETISEFDSVSAFVRLRRNCGVTVGRNVGARIASSDLVVFLDDDAVPEDDFVAAHQRVHDETDALGVRGRVLTTKDTLYNRLQWWYDLGDEPRPYYLNTEGNSSYDRETFLSVDGFDETIAGRAGHEGIDLTYRLVEFGGHDREKFIYHPDPVVYHDVASDPAGYVKKRATKSYYRRRLPRKRPDLWEFTAQYDPPETDRSSLRYRDRVLARVFGITAEVGCRVLELRKRISDKLPVGG